MKLLKFVKRLSVLFLIVLLVVCCAYVVIEIDGNFHVVEDGYVYRSAQLDGKELTNRVNEVGIKSILNLRGENRGEDWYETEVATSNSLGIKHLNYRMSAGESLNLDQMNEVLHIIENAPKPILIHCKAGADRTGLVSAIYLANKGENVEKVHNALSVRYGHLPIFHWSSTIAMDESLNLFLSKK